MVRTVTWVLAACLMTTLTGCSFAVGEPAKALVPEMPHAIDMPSTPPPSGLTRVVLDVDKTGTVVEEVLERAEGSSVVRVGSAYGTSHAYSERTTPVCIAPCVVDLAPGLHQLRLRWDAPEAGSELVPVQINAKPRLIRRATGWIDGSPGFNTLSVTLAVLAVTALAIGGSVYATGAIVGKPELEEAGIGTLIGGGIALGISVPLMLLTRTVTHHGTTTDAPLPR